jgi:hypothetical protein
MKRLFRVVYNAKRDVVGLKGEEKVHKEAQGPKSRLESLDLESVPLHALSMPFDKLPAVHLSRRRV